MVVFRKCFFVSAVSAMLLASTSVVDAQGLFQQELPDAGPEIEPGTTVTNRPRPELDPLGARIGDFLFHPKLAIEVHFVDNVFSTETGQLDDFRTVINPGMSLNSDWANHEFNLNFDFWEGRYADLNAEDYSDYSISVDGRFDVTREIFLFGNFARTHLHENRGSVDDTVGINPTEFDVTIANIQYSHSINRFTFLIDGLGREFDFDDTPRRNLPDINQDDRDRRELKLDLKASYEITPEYEAFVRFGVNDVAYDEALDDNGFNRDSHGFEAVVGTEIDFGGKSFGSVFVGYQVQQSSDATLSDVMGATFGLDLTWNPGTLTTVQGGITRTVEQTTLNGAAGSHATGINLSVDHELLRNLIISANASASLTDYVGISREDRTYIGGLNAKYMLNRNFFGILNYTYLHRDSDESTGGDSDFRQNLFMIRIGSEL